MATSGQKVTVSIRKMIMNGELAPGERLGEEAIAKRLGVSRTPIRVALRLLAQEGLLETAGARGYAVRKITQNEIADAVLVRGALEGLAAMLLAEKGPSSKVQEVLSQTLDEGDALFIKGFINEEDISAFHRLNITFHNTIVEGCGNTALADALQRNDHLPFASANSIALDPSALDKEYDRFKFANMQHHIIFDAIMNGQGARAEAAMREHANAAIRYAKLFGPGQNNMENMRILRQA